MPSHDACCAPGCSNRRDPFDKALRFHRIPADPGARRVWLARINRANLRESDVTSSTRLCSEHFFNGEKTEEQPLPVFFAHKTYPLARRGPKRRAQGPSDMAEAPQSKRRRAPSALDDSSCMEAAEGLLLLQESVVASTEEADSGSSSVAEECFLNSCRLCENDGYVSRAGSPSLTGCAECQSKDEEICLLKRKILELEEALEAKTHHCTIEKIADDDAQVQYYTGLPSFEVFSCLFTYLEPNLGKLHRSNNLTSNKLSPRSELFMVLMQLVKGTQVRVLAYRFGFKSYGRISILFRRWIKFLSTELQAMIKWPSRRQIKRNLPSAFAKDVYESVRCIIDCTEFAIQAPSSLSLNAMTYSDYKGEHTIKVLVGTTPDGYISFVSRAYPGSISDNAILAKSGILDMCEPGDVLLADKGFTISNSELQPRGLTLIVPPFRDGDAQFSPGEVKETREIAILRIIAENAILRMKFCKLLKSRLPINSLHTASDYMIVSAALANWRVPLRK